MNRKNRSISARVNLEVAGTELLAIVGDVNGQCRVPRDMLAFWFCNPVTLVIYLEHTKTS